MGKWQAGQAYSSLLVTDYSLKQPYTQSSTDKKIICEEGMKQLTNIQNTPLISQRGRKVILSKENTTFFKKTQSKSLLFSIISFLNLEEKNTFTLKPSTSK